MNHHLSNRTLTGKCRQEPQVASSCKLDTAAAAEEEEQEEADSAELKEDDP